MFDRPVAARSRPSRARPPHQRVARRAPSGRGSRGHDLASLRPDRTLVASLLAPVRRPCHGRENAPPRREGRALRARPAQARPARCRWRGPHSHRPPAFASNRRRKIRSRCCIVAEEPAHLFRPVIMIDAQPARGRELADRAETVALVDHALILLGRETVLAQAPLRLLRRAKFGSVRHLSLHAALSSLVCSVRQTLLAASLRTRCFSSSA